MLATFQFDELPALALLPFVSIGFGGDGLAFDSG
jgi:hypothetical protein